MDDLTERLAAYTAGIRSAALPRTGADAVVAHIVDAVGCMIAGAGEAPTRVARGAAAEAVSRASAASVIGLDSRSTPALAAFANAVAVRCLDFNDTFNGRTGGHPSDMMPGVLAAAEAAGRSGADFVRGVYVAYEAFGALADQVPLRELGIDQGALLGVATSCGIGVCLGLDEEVIGNAVSLALTTTQPLRVSRAGELSEWKGAATAHAVMNAVFVTGLAARGMTGPPEPFRGPDGFLDRTGIDIDLGALGQPVGGRRAVERCSIKLRPVEYGAQAPVELFIRLRPHLKLDEIERIDIAAYDFLYREIGGGRDDRAAKWDPQTRETADHSLPYLLAVTLLDGEVTLASFRPERVRDPALRPLMQKIAVTEDPATKGMFPPRQPVRVRITLASGEVIEEACEYPAGHPTNPASDAQIDAKFLGLASAALGDATAGELLTLLRGLATLDDLGALTAALRAVPADG